MKKIKSRIAAFFMASALLGGALVGCGKAPSGPVEPVKYTVSYTSDAKYQITGLNSDSKYEDGDNVEFTVSVVDTAYELRRVEADGNVLQEAEGKYSFTMPAHDVEIVVTLNKKDVWDITFTPALKVSFTSTVAVTLNDQPRTASQYTLESSDPTKAEIISSTEILGKAEGAVTITVKQGTTTVLTKATTVKALEKGDTKDYPMSTTEAYDAAKALGSDKSGQYSVYIKGKVKSIIEHVEEVPATATSEAVPAYASYWLDGGGTKDFEVYRANFADGTEANLDVGSEVIVYAKLRNYKGSTMETVGGGELQEVNNAKPYAIVSEKTSLFVKPSAVSDGFGFRIAPKGSSDATITYTSKDTAVAIVAADGKVTGVAVGQTKITAEAIVDTTNNTKLTKEATVFVSNSDNDGTEQHPFTTDEAISLALSLANQAITEDKFYYTGVVCEITNEFDSEYNNMGFKLKGTDTNFVCYRMGAKDTHDNIVKGAVVTCCSQLQNYGGVAENKNGSVTAADKTAVKLIEVNPDELQISLQETTHTTLVATTYPEGINEAVSFGILGGEDPNVVSVSDGGLVTPLKVGETIIRVSCQDGVALVPVEVVDGPVIDKWAAQDASFAPLHSVDESALFPTTPNVESEEEYYFVGKLGALSVAAGHVFSTLTSKDGRATIDLVDLFDSTGNVKYPDMTVNLPKEGDIVIVKGVTLLYQKSGETTTKNEVKNVKLVQLNGVVCVPPTLSGLVIDPDTLSIAVGKTATVQVYPDPIDAVVNAADIVWNSPSANVTVTPDSTDNTKCVVTGVTKTDTPVTITATVVGKTAGECAVTVKPEGSTPFEAVTGTTITTGRYVIGAFGHDDDTKDNYYFLPAPTQTVTKNPALATSPVTDPENELKASDAWTFTVDGSGHIVISYTVGSKTYYLEATNAAQGIKITDSATANFYWTLTSDGLKSSVSDSRVLQSYNNGSLRYYAVPSISGQKVAQLYKYVG